MIPYIVLGAAALVGYVASRPGEFTLSRSKFIKAPPDRIFPHLIDFRKWEAWSPWEGMDPNLKRTHSGQPSGPGAVYDWEGNNKVGKGRMTIIDATTPTRLEIKLEFMRPWQATNITTFTLVPDAEGTNVTWAMSGNKNFMMKAFGVFMDMDKMVGNDFVRGLEALQGVAEAG